MFLHICLKARHVVNITRTPWEIEKLEHRDAFSSRYHLPKKKNHCLLPESDTEDSLIPQSTPEQTQDTPITYRLIGAYRYHTCIHLCPYTPRRRCHGVGRGQPVTDPSPGTMTHICSPCPDLTTICPSLFKFDQESCFFFLTSWYPYRESSESRRTTRNRLEL